ncbi:neural cell adhesion molecule 2-like [Pseudonaja textilis]|uniref:neural cell adhesion molecule 2-like n=1 Tax=Pseudonaja textilis TaxID=8673 RepID=UPI000EAA96DF|nr:neural cell adhesion molecule 2-like [Pseudonaja textilis]
MGAEHFLVFIFAAGAVQGASESLEIIPINGNVELNTQTSFICKVRGSGEAALTWIDPDGNEIEEDSKPYWVKAIDETSKEMQMTLTRPDQGGIFRCNGEFDLGKTATERIEIHVIQKPTFVDTMDLVKEVHEGQNVEFSCLVKGIPPPTIRWLFGNQDIKNIIRERQLFIENGKLLIENTQLSDAGIYICEASIKERNEVAFANFTLKIKFAPKIELLTSVPLVTQTGNPIQVNFTVLANPSPSVSIAWKEKIFEEDAIEKIAQDQNRYLFLFEAQISQEDIPELVITAANEVGIDKKSVPFEKDGGLGWGSILAIVLAILALFLLIDALCYYKRRCGFLMFCKKNILCKKSTTGVENNGKILSKSGKSPVVNISGSEA